LLAAESRTKQHFEYAGAKSGDAVAAVRLVHALVDEPGVAAVRTLIGSAGTSGPPVLVNVVAHTGADGFGRLARQAAFAGEVDSAREYVLVDESYSARLNPTQEQLNALRRKHGSTLEGWWRERFGHAFDCLTQSEARYLTRSPDVDTIRSRIAAAKQEGDGPCRA
jgi:hypothetical protein